MDPIGPRVCWRCQEEKSIHDFCRGGKDTCCKKCRYQQNAIWMASNREKVRAKRAAYMVEYRARKSKGINAALPHISTTPVDDNFKSIIEPELNKEDKKD